MDSEPDDFEDSKPDWKETKQFVNMLMKMQGIKPDRLPFGSKKKFEKKQRQYAMRLVNKE